MTTRWGGILWSWWWEITGALVTITSMGLILLVLGKADGLALSAWTLPIQPNSLIAIFTTIGKSAMMVPIAGCLSQLAWQHFSPRAQSLDHIQVFSDASRGPWGALELLLTIRKGGLLARILSVATLLALGIEPMVQQILEFRSRQAVMPGQTVEIGSAVSYSSRSFQSNGFRDNDYDKLSRMLTLKNDVANAILLKTTQPYFSCPPTADNCTYPAHTTLGVCSVLQNQTESLTAQCETSALGEVTCLYEWPERASPLALRFNAIRDSQDPLAGRQHEVFKLRAEASTENKTGLTMTALRARTTDVLDSIERGAHPKAELLTLHWYWCTQTYSWTNSSAGDIFTGAISTEPLEASGHSQDNTWYLFKSKSDQREYQIALDTEENVWTYIGNVLTSHVLMNTDPSSTLDNTSPQELGTDYGRCNSDFEIFLYTSNLGVVTSSIADMISNYIRSSKTGDNAVAGVVLGRSWAGETFIYVRWGWLVLPLVEALLVIILLLSTILSAKLSGIPLLGSSPLGLLFYGLDCRALDTAKGLEGKTFKKEMTAVARNMEVRFADTSDEGLRFITTRRIVDEKI
ncbi:hypothetical protein B0T25DRAFT_136485 [Lasiosphaeria hispida]|uniref:Uncharacterized protein n=1 Tax=Lasiosphaeria hispida TaxID=260671 RepID=A0AAJ0HKN1_9PEZI|nr:hypothetical protein B0T25DRAFT_136485 [Lasiosphaeria hispida]